jgi:hypothetical protein
MGILQETSRLENTGTAVVYKSLDHLVELESYY